MTCRQKLRAIFESQTMHAIIGGVIIFNMVILGLATSSSIMSSFGKAITFLNHIILAIFAIEISIRFIAHDFSFLKDPWHVLDLIIVGIALCTVSEFFQIFRVIRIIWLLRLMVVVPQFHHLINAILRAIPHLLSVAFLLFLTVYVFGVIGTLQYGQTNPQLFGTLYTSMGTLVESLLMEHTWSERLEALRNFHPYAWLYVYPVMILLNYLLLHLFIAVILSSLHRQYEQDQEEIRQGFLKKVFGHTLKEKKELSAEGRLLLHKLEELQRHITQKP